MKRIHLSPKHQRVLSLVKKSKLCHNSDMEHHNNRLASLKRKCAFTLAEVLITLAIIGVVAAMTLPSVINDAQDKQFKAMFKKQYSAISQALQMVYVKDGESLELPSGLTQNNVRTIMSKFVCKMAKELKAIQSGVICSEENLNQPNSEIKYNGKVQWHTAGTWFNKKKESMGLNGGYKNTTLVLSDGAMINFNCGYQVFVDVNGYKGPNTIGRDIFYFILSQDNNAPIFFKENMSVNGCTTPYNIIITKDNYKEDCESGSGWGCSPLYIME